MKLIIDIPDDDFNFIKDLKFVMGGRGNCKTIQYDVINAIKNGAPLPKGRGRLIDADDFFEVFSELDISQRRQEQCSFTNVQESGRQ